MPGAPLLDQLITQLTAAFHADYGAIFLRDSDTVSELSPLRELAVSVIAAHVASSNPDRTALAAPLKTQDDLLGAIGVTRQRAFENGDLELLTAFAQTAALALASAQQSQDAQRKLENLSLLQEISADLTSTLDLERVLTKTLQRVQETLNVDNANFLFREREELVFQIAIGVSADRIKPFRLQMGQGITGWVAQHACGDFSNDVPNDPRYYRAVDTEIHFVTHSLIAAPLVVNNNVIGVISATNKPGGFNPADLDLLNTIAASAAIAIENARLYQVAVEKGRMERELQVARQVQSDLIPREMPQFPGWEIAGLWQPAREVSGDYYDFVAAGKYLDLVIADVSDKGMPAALLMAQTRSIIRANLLPEHTLARGVTRANDLVCASAARDMFVTMACVRLDARSGKIICVNAGHNPPLIWRARSGGLIELSRTGIALGIFDSRKYGQKTERLQRGDCIVLYTDGVTDAMNEIGEVFGEERLHAIVLANRGSSAADLIAAYESELKKFIGSAAPADDITILIARKI